MIDLIEIESFLQKAESNTVIDVRSPVEYNNGHIPGSVNIPIFSDEERKVVGTQYKQINKETALFSAFDFVGQKMTSFIKSLKKITKSKEVLVYCWRGGMRSKTMAFIFSMADYHVYRLQEGYKIYRSHIHKSFEQKPKLMVLGGKTGSGKTEILFELEKAGYQVLDLEKTANHKGSVFGSIGQQKQPTCEQFENNLYLKWCLFDFDKIIWIEDESAEIGKIRIPYPIYKQIRKAPVINIELKKEIRAQRLVLEYAGIDDELLRSAITRINKRLGGQNTKIVLDAIDKKDYYKAALYSLTYYDKAYTYGLSKRETSKVFTINILHNDVKLNAKIILKYYKELTKNLDWNSG